ncbi:MAG: hypothetical protein VYC39_16115 [Myxococcota bacterium]|nr:hypothetical protein [Myxococcota bacterium]
MWQTTKYGETSIPVAPEWEDATVSTWSVPSSQDEYTQAFSLTLVQRRLQEASINLDELIYPSVSEGVIQRTRRPNIPVTSLEIEARTAEWYTESPVGSLWQIQCAFTRESWIYILTGSATTRNAQKQWGPVFEEIVSSIDLARSEVSSKGTLGS